MATHRAGGACTRVQQQCYCRACRPARLPYDRVMQQLGMDAVVLVRALLGWYARLVCCTAGDAGIHKQCAPGIEMGCIRGRLAQRYVQQ